jgi:isopenicillin N synthase-like dioxygenase
VRGELVTLRETYDYHPLAPVFVPELHLLHDELTRLVGEVIGWIDRTAEGNRGKKLAELRQGQNVLRVAHQLESCAPDRVSFRDHYDFGLFTAFLGGADGLEGNLSGQWVKIDLAPGDVFVGAGTVLTKFFPRLRPFHHRVVGGETGRLSAFLFFDPHEDEALPGGGTFGEFLAGKMEAVRVAD